MKSRPSSIVCETLGEALAHGAAYLAERKLRSPHWDSELIIRSIVGCTRAFLFSHPDEPLSVYQQGRLHEWLLKRGRHYPTQYLRGKQEFFGRNFLVDPRVLIPRPETELLVDVTLQLLNETNLAAPRVLDAGTGSGCIAISLACELPTAELTATDVSPGALEVARVNASLHGCDDRIRFRRVAPEGPLGAMDSFDLIVSNPPYVGVSEKLQVDQAVREFEPFEAVFAGDTGMEVYGLLFSEARRALQEKGRLVLELGSGRAGEVKALASKSAWRCIDLRKDLAGIERCAVFSVNPNGLRR